MGNNDSKPESQEPPKKADSSFEHVSDSEEYSTGDEAIPESLNSKTQSQPTTDKTKVAQHTPKKYSPFAEKFRNLLEDVNEKLKISQISFDFENIYFDFKAFSTLQHEKIEECLELLLENLYKNFHNIEIYRNIFYMIFKNTRISWPNSPRSFEIAFSKIYMQEFMKIKDRSKWNDVVMFGVLMCELLGVYQADYYFITRQLNKWIFELINIALDGDDNGLIAFMLILNRLSKSLNPIKANYRALWDVLKLLVGEDSQESKTTSIAEILKKKLTAALEDPDEVKYQEEVSSSDMCHRFEKFLELLDERKFTRFDLNHFNDMTINEIEFMTRKIIEHAIENPQKIKFLAFISFEYQNLLLIIRRFINKVVQVIEAEIDEIKKGNRYMQEFWYFKNMAELIGELYVSEKKIISPVMLTHWLTVVLKCCGNSSFNIAAITLKLCGFLFKVEDQRNFNKVLVELKEAAVTDEKKKIVAEIEELSCQLDDKFGDQLDEIYASRLFKAEPDAEMIFEIKSFLYHLQIRQRAKFNYHTLYDFDNHDCFEIPRYIIKKISQVEGDVVNMSKFLKTIFKFSFKIGTFVKKLKANFEIRVARMSPENLKEMKHLGMFIGELRNLMVIDKVPQDEWLTKVKSFEPLKNHEVLRIELEVFKSMMTDLHQHDEKKYLKYIAYVLDLKKASEYENLKQDDQNEDASSKLDMENDIKFSSELITVIKDVCSALLAPEITSAMKNIIYKMRVNCKINDWSGLIQLNDRKEYDMQNFVKILFFNAVSNRFVIKNYASAIGKLVLNWSEDERGREFKKILLNTVQINFEAQLVTDNPNEDDLKSIVMLIALLLKEKILTEKIILIVLNKLKEKQNQDLFKRCVMLYTDTLLFDVGLIRRNSNTAFSQELRNAITNLQMELKESSGQPSTSKNIIVNEINQLSAGPSGINSHRSQTLNNIRHGAKKSTQANQKANTWRKDQQTVSNSWRSNLPLANSGNTSRSTSVPNQQRQILDGSSGINRSTANSSGRTQSVNNSIVPNQMAPGINQIQPYSSDQTPSNSNQKSSSSLKNDQAISSSSNSHKVATGSSQIAQITSSEFGKAHVSKTTSSRDLTSSNKSPETIDNNTNPNKSNQFTAQQFTEWHAKFAKEFIQTGQFDSAEIRSFMIPQMTVSLEAMKSQLNSLYNCMIVKPTLKQSLRQLLQFLSEEVNKANKQIILKLIEDLNTDCNVLKRKHVEPKRIEFLRTMRTVASILDKVSFYSIMDGLTDDIKNDNLIALRLFLDLVEETKDVFTEDCQDRNYYIPIFIGVLERAANFKINKEMKLNICKTIGFLSQQNWNSEKFEYSNSRESSEGSKSLEGSNVSKENNYIRKPISELISDLKTDCDALRRKDNEPKMIEFLKKIRSTAPILDKKSFYTILEDMIFYIKNGDIRAIRLFLDIVEETKEVLAIDCQERNYYVPIFIGVLKRAAEYRTGAETQQKTLKIVKYLTNLNWTAEKFGNNRVQNIQNQEILIPSGHIQRSSDQAGRNQSIPKSDKIQSNLRQNNQAATSSEGNHKLKGSDKRRAWYIQHMRNTGQQSIQRQSQSDQVSVSSSCASQGSGGSRRSRKRNKEQSNRNQVPAKPSQINQCSTKPLQNNQVISKPDPNNQVSSKPIQNIQTSAIRVQNNQIQSTSSQGNQCLAKPVQNNQAPLLSVRNIQESSKPTKAATFLIQSNQISAKDNNIMNAPEGFKENKKIEFYISQLDDSNVLEIGKKIAPLLRDEQLENETLNFLFNKGISDAKSTAPIIGLFQFLFKNRGFKDKRQKMSNIIYNAFMRLCGNDKDMIFYRVCLVKFTKEFDPFIKDSTLFILWRNLLECNDNPHALYALVILMEDKLDILYGGNQRINFIKDFLSTLKAKVIGQPKRGKIQVDPEIKEKILKIVIELESREVKSIKVKNNKTQLRKTLLYEDQSSLVGSQSSIDSKGSEMSNRKLDNIESLKREKTDANSAQVVEKIPQPGTFKQIDCSSRQFNTKPAQIDVKSNSTRTDSNADQIDKGSASKVQTGIKPKEQNIIDNRISIPIGVDQVSSVKMNQETQVLKSISSEVDRTASLKVKNVIQAADLEQKLKSISLQENHEFEQNQTIYLDQMASSSYSEPLNEEDRVRVINFTINHFLLDDSKSSTEKFDEILTSMIKQCVASTNDNLKIKESIAEAIVLIQCFMTLENAIDIQELAECFIRKCVDFEINKDTEKYFLKFLKAVKFMEDCLDGIIPDFSDFKQNQEYKCDRFTKSVLRIKSAYKIKILGPATTSKKVDTDSKSSKLVTLPLKYTALSLKSTQHQSKTLFVQKFIEQLQNLILDVFAGRVFSQGIYDKIRRSELVCNCYLQNIFTSGFVIDCLESLLNNDDEQTVDTPGCIALIIKNVGAMLEIKENEKLNQIIIAISTRKYGFDDFAPTLLELRESRWSSVENFTPIFLNFHENPAKFFTFIETLWKKLMESPDIVLELADTVEELWLHLDENFTILMAQFIENRRISFERIPAEKFTNMVRQRLKASILFAFELSELEILDSEQLAAWMTAENLEKLKDKEKIEIQNKFIEKM